MQRIYKMQGLKLLVLYS